MTDEAVDKKDLEEPKPDEPKERPKILIEITESGKVEVHWNVPRLQAFGMLKIAEYQINGKHEQMAIETMMRKEALKPNFLQGLRAKFGRNKLYGN